MIIPIFLLALMVALHIAIGVYVYRDAKSRSMSAGLWTLIAIFTPGFIGLIIYLVVAVSIQTWSVPGAALR